MGTNYYTKGGKHIGKASAAGRYCWDCQRSLCKLANPHMSKPHEWHDRCPNCGGQYIEGNTAEQKSGVTLCCSFTWAIPPDTKLPLFIRDEYGRIYNRYKFVKTILGMCPIQFTDHVGVNFS